MADVTPAPLTDAEAQALVIAVTSHQAARAHVVDGEVRWACHCGQPLEPSDPSAAFGDLTSHQAHEVLIVAHDIKTDAEAAARADALRAALSAFPDCTGCFEPGHPCGDPVCAARDRVRAALTTGGDRG